MTTSWFLAEEGLLILVMETSSFSFLTTGSPLMIKGVGGVAGGVGGNTGEEEAGFGDGMDFLEESLVAGRGVSVTGDFPTVFEGEDLFAGVLSEGVGLLAGVFGAAFVNGLETRFDAAGAWDLLDDGDDELVGETLFFLKRIFFQNLSSYF